VKLSTDSTDRGNPVRRKLLGEQFGRLFLQRVCSCLSLGLLSAYARELRMTIMSSSYAPTSATAGHAATAAPNQAVPETMGHVGRQRRRDTQAEQAPGQHGNRRLGAR
jgi:hypothetical protein